MLLTGMCNRHACFFLLFRNKAFLKLYVTKILSTLLLNVVELSFMSIQLIMNVNHF